MAEIIPAIIPKDLDDLREKMSLVAPYVSLVQIDVTDGRFVPSRCWPYNKGDIDDPSFEKIKSQEEGFPFWDRLDFEVDLMVVNPEAVVADWIEAGARRLVIHVESTKDLKSLLRHIAKDYLSLREGVSALEIGLALNINTPNEIIYELMLEKLDGGLPLFDFVQFMGIAKIGYQGQKFDDRVLKKIRELREISDDITISIDGGVDFDNAIELVASGVDRLISGSAIYESGDVGEAIAYFEEL